MTDKDKVDINLLKSKAQSVRRTILNMTSTAKSGHPGGSLSVIDLLVSLYFYELHHDPQDPESGERDRLVLCKGHAAPALYGVLAESGYFPREELNKLRKINSMLEGHPCRKSIPGIDASTGSLGQGLSISCGMAASAKLAGQKHRVYAILGDGEIQEGQVWEAAMAASHYKLDNLCAVLDRNCLQIDGGTEEVMSIEPVVDKWLSFGWNVLTCNGHSFEEITEAFDRVRNHQNRPTIIIAKTTKGKGISFMEGVKEYHGRPLNPDELTCALEELA
ncbi:MAG: transketolase [Candidatus Altiarchaeales archaeon]|nr:transketolase [Candidatus Altiarchaeales archaeon]